ncbi:MAG: LysR family hydrogen peroxide-inducible transcriptional activator, partial [Alteromonadaceae bacterium]
QRQSKPMAGKLVLGCIATIAPFLLSTVAREAATQYPDLQLMLREDTSDNLLGALGRGEVDLVILALPYNTGGFTEVLLGDDVFNLVLHKNIAQTFASSDVAELPAKSIYLLQKEHCLAEHTQSLCHLFDTTKINPFLATSLQTLVQMVDAHQGATFLPQMAINSDILHNTDLISRAAEPATAHRKIAILWRSSSRSEETYRQLGEIIRSAVAQKCRA